jgi:hypothetical protein
MKVSELGHAKATRRHTVGGLVKQNSIDPGVRKHDHSPLSQYPLLDITILIPTISALFSATCSDDIWETYGQHPDFKNAREQ